MIPPRPGSPSTPPVFVMPRYEDITQDGRVILTSIMHGLGATAWTSMMKALDGAEAFRMQGILPILSRLVVVSESPGPFTVYAPIRFDGSWSFAREKNGERLFLNMWMDARAPVGSTFAPTPPKDAETVVIARVFAEHVVTKPFAPPEERRVTKLEGPGLPDVSTLAEHVFETAPELVAGAPLERVGDFVFGMMHTDSNQHVNSLVYPRVFEEALVRHLADRPEGADRKNLLARAIEMRWRKPFFTHDRAVISLATKAAPSGTPWKLGACGAFAPEGVDPKSKPSCTIDVWMA